MTELTRLSLAAARDGLKAKSFSSSELTGAYLDGLPGGALFAAPGTASAATLTVSLTSGRDYVLLCQLRDTVGASTHAMLGMFHLVHVK